jgi:AcrR family transcriptional regulator
MAQKRVEILRSAARYFNRKSYHGTTMADISKQLLMTKGSLYYYFKNKEEILYFCHDYSLDLLFKNLRAVQASGAPADEQLRRLIHGHVLMILDELKASAMTMDFDALSPRRRATIIEKRDRYERALRQIIEKGVDDGIFRPCDPKMVGFAILGSINWLSCWFSSAGELASSQVADAFTDYLVSGLVEAGSNSTLRVRAVKGGRS